VSFLLVIYYRNRESLGAGMITALTNRIGDALFIIVLGVSVCNIRWHFFDYNRVLEFYFIRILILARITKRAQVPFSA